jgi:two-component system NtrC family sensor kinase
VPIVPLIRTLRERCRVCYTCVRECPAKAIRISGGQAQVIYERCIGCGNCVRVCSQGAKTILSDVARVEQLLGSGHRVAALVAPSFPAEFTDVAPARVIGMLRSAGFELVAEVAFGADLVADRYRKLLESSHGRRHIATTCPAVVGYVERYAPALVPYLAPIVSPMIAMARVLRQKYGEDLQIVFLGPCIAKRAEATAFGGEVASVLTFPELRTLLQNRGVTGDSATDSEFDPPHARLGGLFAVSGGLLETAGVQDDLITGRGAVVDGRSVFVDAIHEFEAGAIDARLLEILACSGCIMGPGLSNRAPLFSRKSRVSSYVRERLKRFDITKWFEDMDGFADLNLARSYEENDHRLASPSPDELTELLAKMGKRAPSDELNCGACGYDTCVEHAIAIHQGLAESEMCLPYTIDQLRRAVGELHESNQQLATTQEALLQAEKLASLGQLAAGIAHEVNNPLGIVLMYAHLLQEECGPDSPMAEDLTLIAEQADRCKNIVAGLLNFARQRQVLLQPVDVRDLVQRSLRAVPAPQNVALQVETSGDDPAAELDRDQLIQVLTNLIHNAYDAMPHGGTLTLKTAGDTQSVWFVVQDTGVGIPPANMPRIFTPFFTTKPMSRGTGLGLAVTYGIVKMHRGDLQVESNADPAKGPTGTTFRITLPRHGKVD